MASAPPTTEVMLRGIINFFTGYASDNKLEEFCPATLKLASWAFVGCVSIHGNETKESLRDCILNVRADVLEAVVMQSVVEKERREVMRYIEGLMKQLALEMAASVEPDIMQPATESGIDQEVGE